MRLLASIHDFRPENGACVTIGNFDGVHLGHKSLIDLAANIARQCGLEPVLITFWPHPRQILRGSAGHSPLSTREERLDALSRLDIENIIEMPFTEELAAMPAADFVRAILLPMNLRHLVVGHDFTLGKDREGDIVFLRGLANKWNFKIDQASPFMLDGEAVSSTRLRECLREGDVARAAKLLGRPYKVCGKVAHGYGRGSKLGFPTANLADYHVMPPANGVYAAVAICEGRRYKAVTNIGRNPTFNGANISVESFLLDCHSDLYGSSLCLEFLEMLRTERKFSSPQELAAQIGRDIEKAKAIFGSLDI